MKDYTATAIRDGAWWMLEITGPDLRRSGATQVKRLDQAEAMARDWIRTRFDTLTDADFTVEVVAEFDSEDEPAIEDARAKRLAAETALSASTSATVEAVVRLGERGLSSRDIGTILGISFQHAAAVLSDARRRAQAERPSADQTPAPPAAKTSKQRARRKVDA
ncbi:hypothetical protein GCM10027589_27730 [Actinocorallia lasiicapitis]